MLAFGGCSVDPAAESTPSASLPATPSPRASASVPAGPSVAPAGPSASPSPSGRPTATPETALEALLPNFAGRDYLEKRALSGADVTRPGNGYDQAKVFNRLFDAIGQPPEAFEGASARGSPMSIFAMRVDGVGAETLADAFIEAVLDEIPGGTVTPAKVGGRDGRHVQWPTGSTDDAFVFVVDDVVFFAAAEAERLPLVSEVVATMFTAKLEELLPAKLGGRDTIRYSFPGAAVGETGDMCSLVCPGEPHRFAKELGIGVDQVSIAAAYLEQPPWIAIVAMRVAGNAEDRLIDARIKSSGRQSGPFFARTELTIGGKTVTWVRVGPFDSALDVELLYAHDDVLYIVRPAPLDGAAPAPVVVEAFEALP
jgi:hypothetical protein